MISDSNDFTSERKETDSLGPFDSEVFNRTKQLKISRQIKEANEKQA